MKKLIVFFIFLSLISCGTPKNERSPNKGPSAEKTVTNPQVEDVQDIVTGLLARNEETKLVSLKIIRTLDQVNYENIVFALNKTLTSKLEVGQSYNSLVRVTTNQPRLCSYLAKKKTTIAALPEALTLREYQRDLENTITDERAECQNVKYQENLVQIKWQSKNNTWANFKNDKSFYLAKLNGLSVVLTYELKSDQSEKISIFDPRLSFYQNPILQVERSLHPSQKFLALIINSGADLDDLAGVDLSEISVRDLRSAL